MIRDLTISNQIWHHYPTANSNHNFSFCCASGSVE